MSDPPPTPPGWPGIEPRWTSSAKNGIGTAVQRASRVWFTLSHGILNEVYYPRLDQACLRDLGLIVTDGQSFFSEEKRDAASETRWLAPGVPAFHLVNTCRHGRYRIEKTVVTDPARDVVLQEIAFTPLTGAMGDYHVYVLLAPHLANGGRGNTAWVGDYKGVPMLFASRGGVALAVAASPDWMRGSAGFVGVSDGWQDLVARKRLSAIYPRAENGNVALTGEVDLTGGGRFVVALAFGSSATEAGQRARASLLAGFDTARDGYVGAWHDWQQRFAAAAGLGADGDAVARTSAAVLRCHESKRIPGALIASLSIPWGDAKTDDDLGGYHLVWPRDLVEAAGGLLAAGAQHEPMRVLEYLRVTQSADGSWPQNMWVDGDPYWHGVQLDETAFPILLLDLIVRERHVTPDEVATFWPMVRRAAAFIARTGPATEQDRWEEDAGFAPSTVAVEIAALLVAADMADAQGEPSVGTYLRETADAWNDAIESWMYVQGTDLAAAAGVDGYYVRIAPPETADASSPAFGFVPIKNRPWAQANVAACDIISPDALAFVRFGLRAADDRRIVNTIRAVDAHLKVDFPFGPLWRRYTDDGYGEHEDGSPFDGVGIGRPWPLLAGERGHYEIAAGHLDEATKLLQALEACAGDRGLIPEQMWDGADVPSRELVFGQPSGSAMPLVWAHAEYLKLHRSIRDGRVFDCPLQTRQRYVVEQTTSAFGCWRFDRRIRTLAQGRTLRVETIVPARVHWSTDGWQTAADVEARDTDLGVWVADLSTTALGIGAVVTFTFYWPEAGRWEGADFTVVVGPRA
ncbi:MAG TPA: glucan 1,4-alpha-glucosidase [Vicinamibacterales bacterium]|nr:glucan 1,4-alpha-glucosidase [Vicinamibacterales bacterium]